MKNNYFVIDMHSHVGDPDIPKRIAEVAANNPRVAGAFGGIQRLQQSVGYMEGMIALSPTAENFLKIMNESQTDLAVLSMLGFTEELGGIELCPSDYLAELLPNYKEKFLGFAGIDPRTSNIKSQIEYYIKEKGFSGIKINPNDWGTFPLDSLMLNPIFEKCAELDVPLHVHTGYDPAGVIEYGNPILLDKIANKFPTLKIILEHYGFPYKYEAMAMCAKHENIYLTLAWHFNKLVHHNRFLAWLELEEMRVHAGIDKILYGSDFPATPNNKEVIHFLKQDKMPLLLRLSGVKNWTYEMRAKVLGLNAAKVLNLSNHRIEQLNMAFEKQPQLQQLQMEWSPEAIELLEKIPKFIRGSAIKKIENYARVHDLKIITPEIMEKARNS